MRLRFKTGVIIIIIIQHLVLSLNIFSYKNNIVNISSEKFGTVKIAQINDFKNSTESKVFDLSENLSDKINDISDRILDLD